MIKFPRQRLIKNLFGLGESVESFECKRQIVIRNGCNGVKRNRLAIFLNTFFGLIGAPI